MKMGAMLFVSHATPITKTNEAQMSNVHYNSITLLHYTITETSSWSLPLQRSDHFALLRFEAR